MTNAIIERLKPKEKDLGEMTVKRALPMITRRSLGPWVFFDHFGPAEFGPGQGMNVRPHPHIGLATVTYLFEGSIWHRDSLGSDLDINPGAINLMVAGEGIVHSERTRQAQLDGTYRMHGLQLWHALPAEHEDREPSFHHYPAESIPEVALDNGGAVRVMMGEAFGATSPVRTFAQTLYYEVTLPAGANVTLTDAPERGVYSVEGEAEIESERAGLFEMCVLSRGAKTVTAKVDCRFAVIGGEPLGERHIRWNFVHSDLDKIRAAADRWRAGNDPKVPGDEEDFIPLATNFRV
jgi:redox-sensitive bicupin YhaK (pirin superfamily)